MAHATKTALTRPVTPASTGRGHARRGAAARAAAIGLLIAGCAQAPPARNGTAALLHDELFPTAAVPANGNAIFDLDVAMLEYADTLRARPGADLRHVLIDALYSRRQLRLEYDAGHTRNAAEAFAARAGNCLSLVIMTAAFARHLGVPVNYQSVRLDDQFSRNGDLFLASGHVNLVLAPPGLSPRNLTQIAGPAANWMTIDFLPADELAGLRSSHLDEETVVAMYLNNRAAESLSEGRLADAYAWARAAVLRDPAFAAATNTLAVVYQRAGHAAAAEAALRHVLVREPEHLSALHNLARLLERQGRTAEAQAFAARLSRLEPVPPFHDFDLGRQAMVAGDFGGAQAHFTRELRRQPYQSEVHFWAALAAWGLGDAAGAADHLRQAMENSSTRGSRDLYAGKLEKLKALRLQ